MNLTILMSAIAPVVFIIILGYWAGRQKSFTLIQARGFSHFALHYALPAALFLGMAQFDHSLLIQQGPIATIMIVGYALFFIISYFILRFASYDKIQATLLSYTVSSTAAPIYGLTVLVPIYGLQTGSGVVGLAALITNLFQVSIVIFMLHSAVAIPITASSLSSFPLILTKTLKNPLVWAPVLGTILSLSGITVPHIDVATLHPLAASAAGVAIFACGLTLSSYTFNFASKTVIIGSLICIIFQPVLFFVLIKTWGLKTSMAKATFVSSAMPTSTPSVLFAQQYEKCQSETSSIMLITTLGMVLIIPIMISFSEWI